MSVISSVIGIDQVYSAIFEISTIEQTSYSLKKQLIFQITNMPLW